MNNRSYTALLNKFWFVPCDVIQRALEAEIWSLCSFNNPILEIGIGNGSLASVIFYKIKNISVGIDIDEKGVGQARKNKKYIKVLNVNAENMPFKSGSFNTIISNSTFEHIENDKKAVSEASRVLKKNGLFYITVPTNNFIKWISEYENKKQNINAVEKYNKRANHLHYRDLKEWEKIFSDQGIELFEYKYYFEKETVFLYYKYFKIITFKIRNREIWSYFSSINKYKLINQFFVKLVGLLLINQFKKEIHKMQEASEDQGGMVLLIGKKLK